VIFRLKIAFIETAFLFRSLLQDASFTPLMVENNGREIKSQNVNSKIRYQNSKSYGAA